MNRAHSRGSIKRDVCIRLDIMEALEASTSVRLSLPPPPPRQQKRRQMRSGERPQWREKTYGGVKCLGPVLLPEPTTHPDQPCARGLYGSLTNLFYMYRINTNTFLLLVREPYIALVSHLLNVGAVDIYVSFKPNVCAFSLIYTSAA